VAVKIIYRAAAYIFNGSGLTASTGPGAAGDGDLLLNLFVNFDRVGDCRNRRDPLSEVVVFSCSFSPRVGAEVEFSLTDARLSIVNKIQCSMIWIFTTMNYILNK
jgi:hypothetical protein